jgi:hypothetical protein
LVTGLTPTAVAFSAAVDVRPGYVIVCDASAKVPEGFIRRVVSLRTVSGKTTVTTTSATVLDTLLQGEFDIKDAALGQTGTGRTLKPTGSTTAGVTVAGAEGVTGSASLKLGLVTGWGNGPLGDAQLTGLSYAIELKADTEATVSASEAVTAAATAKVPRTVLPPVKLAGATVKLGPIPVVITAEVTPTIAIEGTAEAGTNVTAAVEFTAATGAELKDAKASTWTLTHVENATGTSTVTGTAPGAVSATWQNTAKIELAGLPGPTVTSIASFTDTVAAGTASPSPSPTGTPSTTPPGTPGATPSTTPSATALVSTLEAKVTGSLATPSKLLGIAHLTALGAQVPEWAKTL